MKLFCSIDAIKSQLHGCVASIGNYDGMHLGHQKILKRVCSRAATMNLPSLLIIFEPLPMEYFLKENTNPRLMTLREKLVILQNFAIDFVLCLRFNAELANLTATQFVKDILLNSLNVRYIVIGDDFAFGSNRTGGYTILKKYIETEKIALVQVDDTKVSSSHIRQALAIGDLETAERLLGRPYSMSGRVAYGNQLGYRIGFPTANIYLRHKVLPIRGVYIARIKGLNTKPVIGVVNVGNRPTINGTRNVLEVHLLDFNKDIYGTRIEVQFIKKLRDEIKFASLDLLKEQIEKDVNQAKQYERL